MTTKLLVPFGDMSSTVINLLRHKALPADLDWIMPEPEDDDFQLALFILYELHYRGWVGVPEEEEWNVDVLYIRQRFEKYFLDYLDEIATEYTVDFEHMEHTPDALFEMMQLSDGPSISKYMEKNKNLDQLKEYLKIKSIYQLREADPHTWTIPRLYGPPKAALVEIQGDEYGAGLGLKRMHSELYAQTLREVGLKDEYLHYLSVCPWPFLAHNNAMTMFGLHRKLRGYSVGHLAMFELTSALPSRRMARIIRSHGFGNSAAMFYDEHVEADSVHEQLAMVDLAGSLAKQQPQLKADILKGAAIDIEMDRLLAENILPKWKIGTPGLRRNHNSH